jgi:hypothetical protein
MIGSACHARQRVNIPILKLQLTLVRKICLRVMPKGVEDFSRALTAG